ncbi:hypothetical protein ACQPYK_24040 [Streptosporangium sp. CA-135522]|uniref:hypothetical protein n=1 Tax=Streptosporangium sp. CA-135522 TaxID=3240072 RepID=UPI003D8AA7D5
MTVYAPEVLADPIGVITGLIIDTEPNTDRTVLEEVVTSVVGGRVKRRKVAQALLERPGVLTDGRSPAPRAIAELLIALRKAGAAAISLPVCAECGKQLRTLQRREQDWYCGVCGPRREPCASYGVRLCRNCVAKSRAEPCSRCGSVREAAARDADGRVLCPHCLSIDPSNQEICTGCDRRRPVSVRTPDGPLCPSCRPWQAAICGICGREAPCVISQATGQPWCVACKQRRARCSRCGQFGRIRGGTTSEPLCATCTRPDPGFWTNCPTCGEAKRSHAGRCARCALDRRLRELLGDHGGQIRPHLAALYQALTSAERPSAVTAWLDQGAAPAILQRLDAEIELTHASLDALPPGKPVEHLRSALVAIGTLPHRDEQMARLEQWITTTIADRIDPDQQHLLHRYAIWHLLRRLRRRTQGSATTHGQLVVVRQHVKQRPHRPAVGSPR